MSLTVATRHPQPWCPQQRPKPAVSPGHPALPLQPGRPGPLAAAARCGLSPWQPGPLHSGRSCPPAAAARPCSWQGLIEGLNPGSRARPAFIPPPPPPIPKPGGSLLVAGASLADPRCRLWPSMPLLDENMRARQGSENRSPRPALCSALGLPGANSNGRPRWRWPDRDRQPADAPQHAPQPGRHQLQDQRHLGGGQQWLFRPLRLSAAMSSPRTWTLMAMAMAGLGRAWGRVTAVAATPWIQTTTRTIIFR